MNDWRDFYRIHDGEKCVILGKGPSASEWASQYNGHEVIIAINDAGKIWQPNYSISRHNWIQGYKGVESTWFMPIVDGWELNSIPYKQVNFRRPVIDSAIWFIPIPHDPSKVICREMMRDLRLMPTPGGSGVNALILAYYMGFSNIEFVGVDGGTGYAQSSTPLAYRPGADNYDALRRQVEHYANLYFPGSHTFFNSLKKIT